MPIFCLCALPRPQDEMLAALKGGWGGLEWRRKGGSQTVNSNIVWFVEEFNRSGIFCLLILSSRNL